MKTYAVTLAALFAASAEARMWIGECPNIDWITNFDHAAFAGQWYEQERDSWFTMEMDQMCSTANYVSRDDGLLDVQYGTVVPMRLYQWGYSPKMKVDCSASSSCEVTVEGKEDKDSDNEYVWGILDTDYNNWHVVYFCGKFMGAQMSWVSIQGKQQ